MATAVTYWQRECAYTFLDELSARVIWGRLLVCLRVDKDSNKLSTPDHPVKRKRVLRKVVCAMLSTKPNSKNAFALNTDSIERDGN